MKGAIAIAGLAALVALSASGLFLSTTSSAHPGSGDVLLRVLHVVLLLSALFYTGFRYTLRCRTSLDELALLLSLACGVNFIVQLTGGSRSEALTREISRAERAGSRLATLILDIDHFKGFNDTYGHAMGDVVLKKVANVLRSGLRKGDVLARFGGEEFVILLPGVSSRSALELAERIRASVESADVHPGGPRKHVTVSVGVSLFPDDGGHGEELLQTADEALYAAKETGRNRAVVYRAVDAAKVSKTKVSKTKATRAEAVGAAT